MTCENVFYIIFKITLYLRYNKIKSSVSSFSCINIDRYSVLAGLFRRKIHSVMKTSIHSFLSRIYRKRVHTMLKFR